MRILIVTQYIYPETFKSNDIAFELSRRGHDVSVLTGIPNYPEGHYYKGYGVFSRRIETINGVRFYRCVQTPRRFLPGFAGLSLNYVTFVVNAIIWIIFFFCWKKKYDAIITHEPSPIFQIIPAILLSKIRQIPVYSWILDIWPDSLTCHLGKRMATLLFPPVNSITNWVYKNSKRILISSKGFAPLINRDFNYEDKISFFPNWSEDIGSQEVFPVSDIPVGYNIMMAGNIGSGLGIDSLCGLFKECSRLPDVNFLLLGDGSALDDIKQFVLQNSINNVFFLGRHPQIKMRSYYEHADAMLITLAKINEPFLNATVPARLQSYMSSGKPILGMIDGGAADLIFEYDLGFCAHAGDYKSLFHYIQDVILPDKKTFSLKGRNSRALYERDYRMEKCIDNLELFLNQ